VKPGIRPRPGNRQASHCSRVIKIRLFTRARTSVCTSPCHQQKGQVLPLGIALIFFAVMSSLLVANTADTVSVKSQLANTADAAAYSGLVWQARALNLQAYTNRAMIANQVSMAQAVSLRSWSLYGRITGDNINTVLGGLPFLNLVTQPVQSVMTATDQILKPIADTLMLIANSANRVLSELQRLMILSALHSTPAIVNQVVRESDDRFTANTKFSALQLSRNRGSWQEFTRRVDPYDHARMRTRASIVEQSLDAFSQARDWEYFDRWFYLTPVLRLKLHKQGTTRLIEQTGPDGALQWQWRGKDTLSLNSRRARLFRSEKKSELPIGWGQAVADGNRSQGPAYNCVGRAPGASACTGWFNWTEKAEKQSDQRVPSLAGSESFSRLNSSYAGLRAFYDLSASPDISGDPRLRLDVEVALSEPYQSLGTQREVSGFFSMTGAPALGNMAALASAEIYYDNPTDITGQEKANLYSPYWDVRLVSIPRETRLQAWALRGAVLPAATATRRRQPRETLGQYRG